jgi:hypothetical protein
MKKLCIVTLSVACLLISCSDSTNSQGTFSVGNISLNTFQSGEKYFLVIPFEWSGEDAAQLNSVEIIENEEPVTESSGITYTFYGGDPVKQTGVYRREDIGEVENISNYEVTKQGTLILEVALVDVKENKNRKLNITYMVNGKKFEQKVSTSTVTSLSSD